MKKIQNLILDFSHRYPEDIELQIKDLRRIDLSDIPGTNLYCTKEAEREIQNRLKDYDVQGIHFMDSGNYHYVTKILTEKISVPFSLVLFDHHNDMQQPLIHDLMSCGSWAGEILRENPYLEQLILIGPDQSSMDEIPRDLKEKLVCISVQELEEEKAEKDFMRIRTDLPAYISIDKDVLDRYSARTNWDQGSLSVKTLEKILSEIFKKQEVIGVDICGECSLSEPLYERVEDEKINKVTNDILYHFLLPYFSA